MVQCHTLLRPLPGRDFLTWRCKNSQKAARPVRRHPPTAGGGANQTVMQSSVPPAFSVSAVLPTPVLRTELCDTSHKDNSQDAKGNTQTQTKAAAAVGKSHWCSTSLLKNEPNGKCVNIGAEIQRIKKCLHSSHRSF